jgi:HlyD family secretion protein
LFLSFKTKRNKVPPMKKPKKLILIVVLAATAAVIYYMASYNKNNGPQPIKTTGVVEALETDISSKVNGKLTFICCREGQTVKAGELVATLENTDFEAALRQAESSLSAEQSTLSSDRDLVESARAGLKVAQSNVLNMKAQLVKADAQFAQSEKDLTREKELFTRGIVAKADLDLAETTRDSRKADVEGAKAALELSKSQVSAADASLKKAQGDLKTQGARISEARHNVELQRAYLANTRIYSPVDAVVEYRSMEPGEVVAPGTSILTLIDLKNLWVRIDLEQGYVTRVKVGQKAEIRIDRLPNKVFEGTVFDIGREGEFAVERDVTRGRQDIKTFRTRIRVNDPEGIIKPGMTVLVEIPEK